jgi:hypothetical protein
MTQILTGNLRLSTEAAIFGDPITLEMSMGNETGAPVHISTFEPIIAPPRQQWPYSLETYKVSVLASFGILQIALWDECGAPVASSLPAPWVTPLLGQRAVAPGEAFRIGIRIDELFDIETPGTYRAGVKLREGNVAGEADLVFEIGRKG